MTGYRWYAQVADASADVAPRDALGAVSPTSGTLAAMLPPSMPRLECAPVVLRPFAFEDAPLVASVANDPLIPLISTVPTSGRDEDVTAYIERQHGRLADGDGYSFVVADATQPVGQIGLWTQNIASGRASTGYWIAPQFRRRGYAVGHFAP